MQVHVYLYIYMCVCVQSFPRPVTAKSMGFALVTPGQISAGKNVERAYVSARWSTGTAFHELQITKTSMSQKQGSRSRPQKSAQQRHNCRAQTPHHDHKNEHDKGTTVEHKLQILTTQMSTTTAQFSTTISKSRRQK